MMKNKLENYKTRDEAINQVMHCSYLIVTNKVTLTQLYELDYDFGLIFDPEDPNVDVDEIIDTLLDHFIYLEEYEKCQDLINIKNENK